ncbi:MAG: hypothetical protein A2Y38_08105 [Spirochaetes bacterium GWB1_59_5]|nr:MAG: hypothetical protein A2Y38_08105 [Spirochaetes bacterium GWB1_59_5]
MITLVWRTDAHLADQAPQSRKDDWRETVLGKLRQVGGIAQAAKADAVLDGGDLFHVKTPSRNTHETVGLMADLHAGYPCPTYGCVGNHDVKYGDLRFLDESPLGTLFKAGVIHRLYDQHEAWFERDGVSVRVVGIPYHGSQYDQNRLSRIVRGKETYLVVVAHLLASPLGGSLFEKEDILRYADLANHDADVWLFGHYHKDQGIQRISAKGKFVVNVGSLSRGALSEDDVKRTPQAVILRFTARHGVQVEPVPLTVEPPDQVFDLEGRVRQESRQLSVEQFVDNLRAALVETEKATLLEDVQKLPNIPDRVRERAILYLEETAEATDG